MSRRSRYLRGIPGMGPSVPPGCHTKVEMYRPPVVVVQRSTSSGDGPERREIGLAFAEGGALVEIDSIDAERLRTDLEDAMRWVREG